MQIPALQKADIGDASLPYLHYKGGVSHIVFVHATGFIPWIWHPVIREFTPQYSVWAPFINDYRHADPHSGGLNWDVLARDLAVFCQQMRLKEPLIVGHSMGATVSALAVGKYGVQARGLMLIEPIYLPKDHYDTDMSMEGNILAAKSIKRRNHWKDEAEAWAYLKKNAFFASWDEEMLRLYLKYGMRRLEQGDLKLACSPKTEAAIFIGARRINPWPFLKHTTCPVTIVEGGETEYRDLVDVRKILAMLPNARLEIVAGAHHLVPMEKPQEVTQLVKGFVGTMDGKTPGFRL